MRSHCDGRGAHPSHLRVGPLLCTCGAQMRFLTFLYPLKDANRPAHLASGCSLPATRSSRSSRTTTAIRGPLELDHQWTTRGEWPPLNRPTMAEGAGFEPADRLRGRWCSRPGSNYLRQLLTTRDHEGTGSLGGSLLLSSVVREGRSCGLLDQEWTMTEDLTAPRGTLCSAAMLCGI